MIYRLVITREADELLLAHAKWYLERSQSRETALAWYDGFLDELKSLEKNPSRGTLAAESTEFDFELREVLYGSGKRLTHRALYRIVGSTIEVLSIRHLAEHPLNRGDL